ncbi:MAG: hypothetical protein AAF211_20800 [Myxococcota bacterium]
MGPGEDRSWLERRHELTLVRMEPGHEAVGRWRAGPSPRHRSGPVEANQLGARVLALFEPVRVDREAPGVVRSSTDCCDQCGIVVPGPVALLQQPMMFATAQVRGLLGGLHRLQPSLAPRTQLAEATAHSAAVGSDLDETTPLVVLVVHGGSRMVAPMAAGMALDVTGVTVIVRVPLW